MPRRKDLPFAELVNEPLDEWIRKHPPPWIAEPKIDGEDLLVIKPEGQPIYGINRYGTVYTPKDLPCLLDVSISGSAVLRGEMYRPGKKVYDLRRAITSNPHDIHIAIHDCLYWNNIDMRNRNLNARKLIIFEILRQTQQNPDSRVRRLDPLFDYLLMVEHPTDFDINHLVLTKQGILYLYELALKQDYEGIVVKPPDSIYKDNACLKMKREVTYDVLLTAVKDTGKLLTEQIPWSFRMETHAANTGARIYVGDVSSGLTVEERRRLWEEVKPTLSEAKQMNGELYYPLKEPIVTEVRAQEVLNTNGNIRLRSPVIVRFRQDKPPESCTLRVYA